MSDKQLLYTRLCKPCGQFKKILVWANGDHQCYVFNINTEKSKNWSVFLNEVSETILPHFGAIIKLVELKTRKVVNTFEELVPNKKYVGLSANCTCIKEPLCGYKTIEDLKKIAQRKSKKHVPPRGVKVNESKRFLKETKKLKNTVIYLMVNGNNDITQKAVFKHNEIEQYDVVCTYLANILRISQGIQYIYTTTGTPLKDSKQFRHGSLYVAVPFGETFINMNYIELFKEKYPFLNRKKAPLKISSRYSYVIVKRKESKEKEFKSIGTTSQNTVQLQIPGLTTQAEQIRKVVNNENDKIVKKEEKESDTPSPQVTSETVVPNLLSNTKLCTFESLALQNKSDMTNNNEVKDSTLYGKNCRSECIHFALHPAKKIPTRFSYTAACKTFRQKFFEHNPQPNLMDYNNNEINKENLDLQELELNSSISYQESSNTLKIEDNSKSLKMYQYIQSLTNNDTEPTPEMDDYFNALLEKVIAISEQRENKAKLDTANEVANETDSVPKLSVEINLLPNETQNVLTNKSLNKISVTITFQPSMESVIKSKPEINMNGDTIYNQNINSNSNIKLLINNIIEGVKKAITKSDTDNLDEPKEETSPKHSVKELPNSDEKPVQVHTLKPEEINKIVDIVKETIVKEENSTIKFYFESINSKIEKSSSDSCKENISSKTKYNCGGNSTENYEKGLPLSSKTAIDSSKSELSDEKKSKREIDNDVKILLEPLKISETSIDHSQFSTTEASLPVNACSSQTAQANFKLINFSVVIDVSKQLHGQEPKHKEDVGQINKKVYETSVSTKDVKQRTTFRLNRKKPIKNRDKKSESSISSIISVVDSTSERSVSLLSSQIILNGVEQRISSSSYTPTYCQQSSALLLSSNQSLNSNKIKPRIPKGNVEQRTTLGLQSKEIEDVEQKIYNMDYMLRNVKQESSKHLSDHTESDQIINNSQSKDVKQKSNDNLLEQADSNRIINKRQSRDDGEQIYSKFETETNIADVEQHLRLEDVEQRSPSALANDNTANRMVFLTKTSESNLDLQKENVTMKSKTKTYACITNTERANLNIVTKIKQEPFEDYEQTNDSFKSALNKPEFNQHTREQDVEQETLEDVEVNINLYKSEKIKPEFTHPTTKKDVEQEPLEDVELTINLFKSQLNTPKFSQTRVEKDVEQEPLEDVELTINLSKSQLSKHKFSQTRVEKDVEREALEDVEQTIIVSKSKPNLSQIKQSTIGKNVKQEPLKDDELTIHLSKSQLNKPKLMQTRVEKDVEQESLEDVEQTFNFSKSKSNLSQIKQSTIGKNVEQEPLEDVELKINLSKSQLTIPKFSQTKVEKDVEQEPLEDVEQEPLKYVEQEPLKYVERTINVSKSKLNLSQVNQSTIEKDVKQESLEDVEQETSFTTLINMYTTNRSAFLAKPSELNFVSRKKNSEINFNSYSQSLPLFKQPTIEKDVEQEPLEDVEQKISTILENAIKIKQESKSTNKLQEKSSSKTFSRGFKEQATQRDVEQELNKKLSQKTGNQNICEQLVKVNYTNEFLNKKHLEDVEQISFNQTDANAQVSLNHYPQSCTIDVSPESAISITNTEIIPFDSETSVNQGAEAQVTRSLSQHAEMSTTSISQRSIKSDTTMPDMSCEKTVSLTHTPALTRASITISSTKPLSSKRIQSDEQASTSFNNGIHDYEIDDCNMHSLAGTTSVSLETFTSDGSSIWNARNSENYSNFKDDQLLKSDVSSSSCSTNSLKSSTIFSNTSIEKHQSSLASVSSFHDEEYLTTAVETTMSKSNKSSNHINIGFNKTPYSNLEKNHSLNTLNLLSQIPDFHNNGSVSLNNLRKCCKFSSNFDSISMENCLRTRTKSLRNVELESYTNRGHQLFTGDVGQESMNTTYSLTGFNQSEIMSKDVEQVLDAKTNCLNNFQNSVTSIEQLMEDVERKTLSVPNINHSIKPEIENQQDLWEDYKQKTLFFRNLKQAIEPTLKNQQELLEDVKQKTPSVVNIINPLAKSQKELLEDVEHKYKYKSLTSINQQNFKAAKEYEPNTAALYPCIMLLSKKEDVEQKYHPHLINLSANNQQELLEDVEQKTPSVANTINHLAKSKKESLEDVEQKYKSLVSLQQQNFKTAKAYGAITAASYPSIKQLLNVEDVEQKSHSLSKISNEAAAYALSDIYTQKLTMEDVEQAVNSVSVEQYFEELEKLTTNSEILNVHTQQFSNNLEGVEQQTISLSRIKENNLKNFAASSNEKLNCRQPLLLEDVEQVIQNVKENATVAKIHSCVGQIPTEDVEPTNVAKINHNSLEDVELNYKCKSLSSIQQKTNTSNKHKANVVTSYQCIQQLSYEEDVEQESPRPFAIMQSEDEIHSLNFAVQNLSKSTKSFQSPTMSVNSVSVATNLQSITKDDSETILSDFPINQLLIKFNDESDFPSQQNIQKHLINSNNNNVDGNNNVDQLECANL